MGDHHCGQRLCRRPCEKTVRIVTEYGAGQVLHLCDRHHEKVLAEAKKYNIPVVDKRVTRRG